MRINTKLNRLDLTKREHQTLSDAKALLLQIAKHGEGDLSEASEDTAECVGRVQAALNSEPVLVRGEIPVSLDGEAVIVDGAVINAPY